MAPPRRSLRRYQPNYFPIPPPGAQSFASTQPPQVAQVAQANTELLQAVAYDPNASSRPVLNSSFPNFGPLAPSPSFEPWISNDQLDRHLESIDSNGSRVPSIDSELLERHIERYINEVGNNRLGGPASSVSINPVSINDYENKLYGGPVSISAYVDIGSNPFDGTVSSASDTSFGSASIFSGNGSTASPVSSNNLSSTMQFGNMATTQFNPSLMMVPQPLTFTAPPDLQFDSPCFSHLPGLTNLLPSAKGYVDRMKKSSNVSIGNFDDWQSFWTYTAEKKCRDNYYAPNDPYGTKSVITAARGHTYARPYAVKKVVTHPTSDIARDINMRDAAEASDSSSSDTVVATTHKDIFGLKGGRGVLGVPTATSSPVSTTGRFSLAAMSERIARHNKRKREDKDPDYSVKRAILEAPATGPTPTCFMHDFQKDIFAQLEHMLLITANQLLCQQLTKENLFHDSIIDEYVKWHKLGRPPVTQFLFDVETQHRIFVENRENIDLNGRSGSDSLTSFSAVANNWEAFAKDLNGALYRVPNSIIRHHLTAMKSILKVLGADVAVMNGLSTLTTRICSTIGWNNNSSEDDELCAIYNACKIPKSARPMTRRNESRIYSPKPFRCR